MKELKVKREYIGKKVLCIKPCIMNYSKKEETTLGKYYEIIDIDLFKNNFDILDNSRDPHSFDFEDDYFRVSSLIRSIKLKDL